MRQGALMAWVATISGITSGLLVTVLIGGPANEDKTERFSMNITDTKPAVEQSAPNGPVAASKQSASNYLALQQLKGRVDHLSQELEDSAKTTGERRTDSPKQAIDLVQAKEKDLAWWRQTRQQYEQEEVDPGWAQATSAMFETDLSKMGVDKGFAVVQSDCRSTQCAVVVEWPSHGEATIGFTDLLHHDYQANCTRQTLLPEPDEASASAPYQMTVIFDCSDWKQNG